ncbi:hypothetical protein OKW96_05645 [Sphingobacterium sp. KU25419]|nr:hypothetical protein OKW96_05645 [Sphingobacterium sp. KU25419]
MDKRQKMSTQVGVDYNLNDKNSIGFLANGNFIFGGGLPIPGQQSVPFRP